MVIEGGCHCGNIRLALTWDPAPEEIRARVCSCAYCSKIGAAWVSNPAGRLRVTFNDPSAVTGYRFATQTADFQLCRRCGCVPLVTSTIDGRCHAVVNSNALDVIAGLAVLKQPVAHGEESAAIRLARRARVWIGDVEIISGSG